MNVQWSFTIIFDRLLWWINSSQKSWNPRPQRRTCFWWFVIDMTHLFEARTSSRIDVVKEKITRPFRKGPFHPLHHPPLPFLLTFQCFCSEIWWHHKLECAKESKRRSSWWLTEEKIVQWKSSHRQIRLNKKELQCTLSVLVIVVALTKIMVAT